MSTPIENLRPGSWVAITAANNVPQEVQQAFAGGPVLPNFTYEVYLVDGRAYQVRAISLPFVLMWCPVTQSLRTVDFRRVELQLLNRDYVEAIQSAAWQQGALRSSEELPSHFQDNRRKRRQGGWGKGACIQSNTMAAQWWVPGTAQEPSERVEEVTMICYRCQKKLSPAGKGWYCPNCDTNREMEPVDG